MSAALPPSVSLPLEAGENPRRITIVADQIVAVEETGEGWIEVTMRNGQSWLCYGEHDLVIGVLSTLRAEQREEREAGRRKRLTANDVYEEYLRGRQDQFQRDQQAIRDALREAEREAPMFFGIRFAREMSRLLGDHMRRSRPAPLPPRPDRQR